jgi:hypothetical protein
MDEPPRSFAVLTRYGILFVKLINEVHTPIQAEGAWCWGAILKNLERLLLCISDAFPTGEGLPPTREVGGDDQSIGTTPGSLVYFFCGEEYWCANRSSLGLCISWCRFEWQRGTGVVLLVRFMTPRTKN